MQEDCIAKFQIIKSDCTVAPSTRQSSSHPKVNPKIQGLFAGCPSHFKSPPVPQIHGSQLRVTDSIPSSQMRFICDGCDQMIPGFRAKCSHEACPDFDLVSMVNFNVSTFSLMLVIVFSVPNAMSGAMPFIQSILSVYWSRAVNISPPVHQQNGSP